MQRVTELNLPSENKEKRFKEYSLWNHGNSAHIKLIKYKMQKDTSWSSIIHTIKFIVNYVSNLLAMAKHGQAH